jgi:hypothetical protein
VLQENLKTREGRTLPWTGVQRCRNCAIEHYDNLRTTSRSGVALESNTDTGGASSQTRGRHQEADFTIAAAHRAGSHAEAFAE